MDTVRAQTAAITSLIARTVGDASDGIRFCVVASKPGLGVSHIAEQVARVFDMQKSGFRMGAFDAADLVRDEADTGGQMVRHALKYADTPLVVLGDCEAATPATLRTMVELLSSLDKDRHGASRMMIVVLQTTGPACDAIRAVRDATGRAPAGFVVLDHTVPVLEAA